MEDPEAKQAKRRKEEELIYNTLKEFFIGAGASNSIKDTLKAIFYGQNDVGDAITDHHCEPEFECPLGAPQHIGSTHGIDGGEDSLWQGFGKIQEHWTAEQIQEDVSNPLLSRGVGLVIDLTSLAGW